MRVFLAIICFCGVIRATETTHETATVRSLRKFGFQAIKMGPPYAQALGVGAAINVMRTARARFIYAPGVVSSTGGTNQLDTFVASFDGFLFDRSLTPMVSLQAAVTRASESFGRVFGRDARHLLVAVGADFLRSDGLNAGAAVNLPINEPVSGISFYLGWHSDLF